MSSCPVTPNQADLLLDAFQSFNEVSTALESAYWELQAKVDHLSTQLEQKNFFLSTVLQSLPCGVLVVDSEGYVTSINRMGRDLFALEGADLPLPMDAVLIHASFSDRAQMLMEGGSHSTEITVSGVSEKTLHCCWSSLRDGERVLVVQDMTRLRLLEKQMREAERIAAMGEIALEVAHEIRNPLGALELFAELLSEDGLEAEERKRYLGNIQVGIRSLNTVLNNMLCVRRSPVPQVAEVSLGEVLRTVADLMTPLLDQRGIGLDLDLRESAAVLVDREMVRQIFTNLMTNAIQALPEGGRLSLRTGQDADSVWAQVEDNGIGIPQKYQRLIFDSGFTMSKGGSGLGLAIVRRLLDSLNGTIEVKSEEGLGTCFTVSFRKEMSRA